MSELQEHYYSENGKQYMVLGTDEEKQEDGYEMKMLEQNQPRPFLPMQIYQMNGTVTFQYDITGKKNMEEQVGKTGFKGEDICRLLGALGKVKSAVEEYLLDLDSVLLQEKYVFWEGENIYFSYYPQRGKGFFRNIKHLWEFVLARLDHGDKEGVLVAYEFYQDILEEVFCPEKYEEPQAVIQEEPVMYTSGDIMEETVEVEEETENVGLTKGLRAASGAGKIIAGIALVMLLIRDLNYFHLNRWLLAAVTGLAAAAAVTAEWILRNPMAFLSRMEEKTKNIKFTISKKELESLEKQEYKERDGQKEQGNADRPSPPRASEMLKETSEVRLRENDKTQLLSQTEVITKRRLEPVTGQGETLKLSRFPAIAGSASNCSLVIRRTGVSRIHLILTVEEEQVYVEDMNSTNGTWLNGCRMEAGRRYALCAGDRLCLGDAEYEYKV